MAVAGPSRETGLPPGVEVGALGRRVVAYLIEALVPGIVAAVLTALLPSSSGAARAVLSILGSLVSVGWALAIWYLQAERAAGPGMRLMKLQLVGFYDGRPIGWVRVLIRALIFWVLGLTGIGLVVMLVFLVLHPRRQGWHDLAVNAVVIGERGLAPREPRQQVAQQAAIPPSGPAGPPPTYAPTYGPTPTMTGAAPGSVGSPPPMAAPLAPPPGYGFPPQGQPAPGYTPARAEPPPAYAPSAPEVPPAYAPSAPEPTAPVLPSDERPWSRPGAPRSGPSAPPDAEPTPPVLGWHAVLDDGRRLVIDHLVLIGRNPQPAPGEEDAELIKVADETRTVSKLHIAVGVDPAGLFVVDRGSTNGSTVTTPGGATRRCTPGELVYVSAGSIVSIGDHWLEIRRGDG